LGDAFFFETEHGPHDLLKAVKEMENAGPNMTPFLMEQFRTETNGIRLYRLTKLLSKISGVIIYTENPQEVFSSLQAHRDKFMQEWDSGEIVEPDQKLAKLPRSPEALSGPAKVVLKNTFAFRRYGVYTLPYLIREIRKTNSAELFATFLIITDHQRLYAEYLDKPGELFATKQDKLTFIADWRRNNSARMAKLTNLTKKLDTELSK
jgi:hypothetical protein